MRLLLLSFIFPTLCLATGAWQESGSLADINKRAEEIETKLENLPERIRYPIGGGLGHGWVMQGETKNEIEWIRFEFSEATPLTSISIVPCVNIDAAKGFGSYGAPNFLTVAITETNGETTTLFNGETPRHFFVDGFPLFLPAESRTVTRIEVSMERTKQREDIFFCLSEIFALNGEAQVGLRASVEVSSSVRTLSSHYWRPAYLNDGQSSLGQPVNLGTGESRFFRGSLESPRDAPAEIRFFLPAKSRVTEVRLFPVFPRVNSMKLADYAYGLPERLDCVLLDESGELVASLPPFLSDPREFNPTRNLLVFSARGDKVSSVRLQITETQPSIDQIPAIALGEIQIIDESGFNLAPESQITQRGLTETEGKRNEGGAQTKLLADGKSRWGNILPLETWLRSLDERGRLLREQESLRMRTAILKQQHADRLQVFLTFATVAALFLLSALWLTRRNRRLELEKVKRQIAGDLHDEVGSNIASIGLLSARIGDEPDLSLSRRIEEITRETEESLREIVWVLHPRCDDALPRIREAATRLLEDVSVEFHIDEEVDLNRLELRKRHHLILWCKEAFHNIRKHAGASEARVFLRSSDGRLKVSISDNGRGMNTEFSNNTTQHPEALAKLHDRTVRLGGVMEVQSSRGEGTRLDLTFLLSE